MKDIYSLMQELKVKNSLSKKHCMFCKHYIAQYKDDYNSDDIRVRPACGWGGNFSFVSHDPARLCKYYERRGD